MQQRLMYLLALAAIVGCSGRTADDERCTLIVEDIGWGFESTYTFDQQLRPVRLVSSAPNAQDTVIEYLYGEGGRLSEQRSSAGPGRYDESFVQRVQYDDQGYPVLHEVDLGGDGSIDFQMTYTNTYDDEGEMRERVTEVTIERYEGQSSGPERETWTPEATRRTWEHVTYSSTGEVRYLETYHVDGEGRLDARTLETGSGSIVAQERWIYDEDGAGRMEHLDSVTGEWQGNESTSLSALYDDFGRPIQVATDFETHNYDYEETCEGLPIPNMRVDSRFRLPGTRK